MPRKPRKPTEPIKSPLKRPMPPMFDDSIEQPYQFAPAPEVYDWLHQTILHPHSPLYNEDHEHLINHSRLCFLWAESGFEKNQRMVLGQCELVAFRASGWQKYRQEKQMEEWFGFVPAALITLSAAWCRTCSDAEFCALLEHELYHLVQRQGEYGPSFDAYGDASLLMRAHDVEEFFGVVRRYGGNAEVKHMVKLVQGGAEVSSVDIAHSCGTCLLRLA